MCLISMKAENKNIPWEIIIRKFKGIASDDDIRQLDEWTNSKDSHQALLNELQFAWISVRKVNSRTEPDKADAWKKIIRKTNVRQAKTYRINTFVKVAAACVLFLLGIGTGRYLIFPATKATQGTRYETRSGKSFMTLPDSTRIWLNSHSAVLIPDDFGKTDRRIEASGEIYLDVQHDPEYPFHVTMDNLTIKVHGTRFTVKDQEADISVSLIEGSVSLISNGNEMMLNPGHTAIFNRQQQLFTIISEDTAAMHIWAGDALYIEDKSLEEVAGSLEKWYNKKIEVNRQVTGGLYYTFTIRDESLIEMLELMKKIGNFQYKIEKDKVVIMESN